MLKLVNTVCLEVNEEHQSNTCDEAMVSKDDTRQVAETDDMNLPTLFDLGDLGEKATSNGKNTLHT